MLIWSTRGKHWGHRFLRRGGSQDPLVDLERAFSGARGAGETLQRSGDLLALRFRDPLLREDEAGRVIIHEVITDDPSVRDAATLQDGIAAVWPMLEEDYAKVWDSLEPPA
ncbi:hypothetical protein [Brachybacterium saurashtrense]|uniref:Uncharacterized protein n=1 Tax=Brachybacterium saurashtrense TaxID=556288 RepID=A0A345YJU8_9MICO|nr:hypothetical protein [Brachybacterium saurashtrense]AXK44200.1 hypothetical protein DWV08_00205 [Brachybacterium saurashtrense]RRR21472.1 hypothetical protein DXU92_14105 [Brachybacterium saurashtrense]